MRKTDGFSLIEVLTAFSIVMMLIMTILPIVSRLQQEEMILSDRRHISNMLHDELQSVIWEDLDHLPSPVKKTIRSHDVTFKFNRKDSYIKGCSTWKNVKERKEEVCLYGMDEK